jgi:hypothetical protein
MNHSTNFIKYIVDYKYTDMILYRRTIFEEFYKNIKNYILFKKLIKIIIIKN